MPALTPSLRDPHCGNLVSPGRGLLYRDHGILHYFCSESCLRHYRYERS
jgi:ribosomal protein L24E